MSPASSQSPPETQATSPATVQAMIGYFASREADVAAKLQGMTIYVPVAAEAKVPEGIWKGKPDEAIASNKPASFESLTLKTGFADSLAQNAATPGEQEALQSAWTDLLPDGRDAILNEWKGDFGQPSRSTKCKARQAAQEMSFNPHGSTEFIFEASGISNDDSADQPQAQ